MIKLEEFTQNERYLVEGTIYERIPRNSYEKSGIPFLIENKSIINGKVIKVDSNGDATIRFNNGLIGICQYEELDIYSNSINNYTRRMVGCNFDFIVKSLNGDTVELTRKELQKEVIDYLTNEVKPGSIIKAKVVGVGHSKLYCDVGRGVRGILNFKNVCVHKCGKEYKIGEVIPVVFKGIFSSGTAIVSTVELYGDWEQNAQLLSNYETRVGRVKAITESGAFIVLTPNISGLADRINRNNLKEGDNVSVFIRGISPDKMRIKLAVVQKLDEKCVLDEELFVTEGRIAQWQYEPEGCVSSLREKVDYDNKPSLIADKEYTVQSHNEKEEQVNE